MSHNLVTATHENFDELLTKSSFLVIDFWAEWCGPCKAFEPIFEQVAAEFSDITFAKVNVDNEAELAQEFSVRSIPFLVIIRDNVALFSEAGTLPANALKDLIQQAQKLDMHEIKQKLGDHDDSNAS